jgi:hypothetical protein
MDWSAAVPSWNPSQLPGLVTNRTLLSAPLFTGPSEPSQAPVFDPIAAKVAIIDQLCIQDLQKKEQLVAATRLTNFDATLNAALNVRFLPSSSVCNFSIIHLNSNSPYHVYF